MRFFRWFGRYARLEHRVSRLEIMMTRVDDVVKELNDATNDIAAELEALRGAVANVDTATAERFGPIVERLRALAADPQNPVPAPGEGGEPTPV